MWLTSPHCLEFKAAFQNAKVKYVLVITSLLQEFNQCFQDLAAIEKDIKLFTTRLSNDAAEVTESMQLEVTEIQCDNSLKSQHQLLPLPEFCRSLEKARFLLMRNHTRKHFQT